MQENKNVSASLYEVQEVSIAMGAKWYLLWYIMGIELSNLPFMAFSGLIRLTKALYSLLMVFLWSFMQNIVFSRGHRSKFIWSCFKSHYLIEL